MSTPVQIDPQIGKIIRLYRKQKKFTQQELGEQLDQVLASRGAPSGSGMSKSFISRIEKALFVPPQNKLEIIVDLIEIPASEAQNMFALCGYTPPIPADILPTRIESLQHDLKNQPADSLSLLELVSLLNQERQFQAMQTQVLEGLLHIETSPPLAAGCIRAILLAKQQLAYALAERDSQQETHYLQLSSRFLQQAQQSLKAERKLESALINGLKAEILRSELSVHYRTMIKTLEQATRLEVTNGFSKLYDLVKKLKQTLVLLPESERIQHFKLYVQRESISLKLKELESIERLDFQAVLQKQWPAVQNLENYTEQNKAVIQNILKAPERQGKKLDLLFQNTNHLLQVRDSERQPGTFEEFHHELLTFLNSYQSLLKHGQGPEQLPHTGILNTYLLYISLLSRFEDFSVHGEYLLKSVYLLCKHQHLANWHYVASCFYSYRYLLNLQASDLDQAIEAWQYWCQVSLEDTSRYNSNRFQSILQEPVIWVACLQGIIKNHWNSKQRIWFEATLEQFLSLNR